MTTPQLHLVVPGSIDQRTGGYVYDARIVWGLDAIGWDVVVHELAGRFPDTDTHALDSLRTTLAVIPSGARVVVDGLAMGSLPAPVTRHGGRLRILSLVHHPLADETGLDAAQRERLVRLESEALQACVGVIVTSDFTATRLQMLGISTDRVRVVRPGVDRARRAIGPGEGEPPCILCVASVTPRKGQDVLMRALGRLREASWSCVCAGSLGWEPAYAKRVQEQARASGVADRVHFVGECDADALDALYDTSSFFALPSYFEGYGMVLAEAMMHGLPVVATTGGAVPGTVPREAGVLVPPGDDQALADALGVLIRDPARRSRCGEAALRHANSLPGWDQAAAEFADAVLDLAPEGLSAPPNAPVATDER